MDWAQLRWQFPISGNYAWFDSFAHNHASGLDFTIIRDVEDDMPPAYAWSSHHLDHLEVDQDVIDRAFALKTLYDGALIITDGHHRDPISELFDARKRTTRRGIEGNILAAPFSEDYIKETNTRRHYDDAKAIDLVSKWIFLARTDLAARGILSFLGVNGATWISLYAAKDYMKTRDNWDEKRLAQVTGEPESEFLRFRHTANNEAAIGPFARHGDLNHQAPKDPMSLDRASDLIRKAAAKFLDHRATVLESTLTT